MSNAVAQFRFETQFTDTHHTVIDGLRGIDGDITATELAPLIGMTPSVTYGALLDLATAGYTEHTAAAPISAAPAAFRWRLTEAVAPPAKDNGTSTVTYTVLPSIPQPRGARP